MNMKIFKILLSFIFNPLNSVTISKNPEKVANGFSKHPFFIFLVAVLLSTVILLCAYYF